ncbi:alpha/beta hydrolase fold domain-containing protein [Microbulbifer sp. SH-1]|uniref:alpha/beta hydrolase n=1 Tax=Microbulbifer sp. SH-1 TaxID=2681547 RepID=UPI00140A790E|nr:alpha/beta hydrolase [Microbulbifer sp. SH-1]QIL91401.1 alpha/beta hydrolase fold domain-containing protein [Microbulbifer sp. SH-1]
MKLLLFSFLSMAVLLAFCSPPLVSSDENSLKEINASKLTHKDGSSANTSFPVLYSQEVSLWPDDSKVIADGIKKIENDDYAKEHPWLVITHPTFIRYAPKGPSARAAVIVFPGGGYKGVAIGQQSTIGFNGADVCQWLTEVGVTCILVKYRVPNSGCSWDKKLRKHVTPEIPLALQDAQRTISIVRYNAKEYGIDPDKIGVMGFSAGGNLAVLSSTAFDKRAYDTVDEIDQVSSRPDFAIPVYPGHLTMEHKNKRPRAVAAQELNTDIKISPNIPPTLLVHAKDDPIDPVHYSEVYARELRKAGIDVKVLLYETGGHAFGVRKQEKDTDRWTADAIEWLKEIEVL